MMCDISRKVALYITDESLSYLSALKSALRPAVDELKVYRAASCSLAEVFDADQTGLVLIAGIDRMPMGAKTAVYDYLCRGGRILNMGNDYIFKSVLGEDGSISDEQDPGMSGLIISTFHDVTELFPITNGVTIGAFANQILVKSREYVLPKSVYSCYPRQEGTSYGRLRPFRCIPLIEVRNEQGLRSGYAAWMMIYKSKNEQNKEREGSIIATFSGSEDFYDANGIAAVVDTVKAMTRDCFLFEGGTKEYTYMIGDNPELEAGASFLTLRGASTTDLETRVTLYQNGKEVAAYTSCGRVPEETGKNIFSLGDQYSLSDGRPDHVVASLYQSGVEIDRLEQDIHYWQPKPVEERKFVYTEDGYFKRDGKIIYLFGVNVMSSTRAGITMDDDYSPEILYNDLKRIKELGFNAVSVWKNNADNNDMLNTVRMCEELGLYVDMGISGHIAYPFGDKYDIDRVVECLTKLHFHECDTIFAYDIAWEERVGRYNHMRYKWNGDWEQWVKDQYGSVQEAARVWGVACERTEEGMLCVTDAALDDPTSKYQKVVAAYYRFVDDYVSRRMVDGTRQMREAAPNQLFSFRMSMSGCGYNWLGLYPPSAFCYDFQSLASSMDVMEPEGYTLGQIWQEAVQIPIATAYARYTKPKAPVLWKEYGWGVMQSEFKIPDYNFNPKIDLIETTAAFYKETLKRMLHAGVDGAFCWWNVAGYRRDEQGDCGIWNPDGSDRPYTVLLREFAPKFIHQAERSEPYVVLTVERDNQVGGINGIYNATCQQVEDAYRQDKTIAFVNNKQTKPDQVIYADEVCDEAVGGAEAIGMYPMRYVNGMIKYADLVEKNGQKVALLTVCNTKQSVWRAGTVSVVSVDGSDVKVDCLIDVPMDYLDFTTLEIPVTEKGTAKLRLAVKGKAFGPVYSVTVD